STRLVASSTFVLSAAPAGPKDSATTARHASEIDDQRGLRVMTHLLQWRWLPPPPYYRQAQRLHGDGSSRPPPIIRCPRYSMTTPLSTPAVLSSCRCQGTLLRFCDSVPIAGNAPGC